MTGTDLVQLYLLAQMRAETLVEQALSKLGASQASLASATDAAKREGLETPGHAMDDYSRLLGPPTAEHRAEHTDRYRELRRVYQLPLWPNVAFSVFGTSDGQTAGLSFVAPVGKPTVRVSSVKELVPWAHTEDQLSELLSRGRALDEWYPQKDYECALVDEAGAHVRCVLCFDFGLLQEVKAP